MQLSRHFMISPQEIPYETTYGGMNSWHAMSGKAAARNIPVTLTDGNWKQYRQGGIETPRAVAEIAGANGPPDEFSRRFNQLQQKVAYKYPDQGHPRERQGNIGGSWRHVKEVLGHGGHRVIFIDGLVRQYDTERMRNNQSDDWMTGGPQMRRSTPAYAPNRHDVSSYGQLQQQDSERMNFKPWQSTTYYAPAPAKPAFPAIESATRPNGSPTKYKGFYTLRRENTYQ